MCLTRGSRGLVPHTCGQSHTEAGTNSRHLSAEHGGGGLGEGEIKSQECCALACESWRRVSTSLMHAVASVGGRRGEVT